MKNTYYYIVTLAMLILAFPVKAASEAEFGKLSKAYTLHADGSQEMRVQKELTLFTHAAMNRVYGESFIIYNPEFQTLKIHDSYTRQKDGTIVKLSLIHILRLYLMRLRPSVARYCSFGSSLKFWEGLKGILCVWSNRLFIICFLLHRYAQHYGCIPNG